MFQTEKMENTLLTHENCPTYHKYLKITDGTNYSTMTKNYASKYAEKIKKFKVYSDDIWVISFPKCGTTWTQEIVWLLNNNLNYDAEKTLLLDERFPFFERGGFREDPVCSLQFCKDLNRPRHIKSHLPVFLLPEQLWTVKPKIFYISRNPKDAAVSYFHHYRHLIGYTGTKDVFFNAFLENKLLYSYMNQHVLEFWKLRNESNMLFLFYEDMKRDLKPEIIKMMNFLSKSYSDDEIDKLCQHVSFESMKNNPSCNKWTLVKFAKVEGKFSSKNEAFSFFREGKIGSYKNEMSEEIKEKFDNYMKSEDFNAFGFAYKTN